MALGASASLIQNSKYLWAFDALFNLKKIEKNSPFLMYNYHSQATYAQEENVIKSNTNVDEAIHFPA